MIRNLYINTYILLKQIHILFCLAPAARGKRMMDKEVEKCDINCDTYVKNLNSCDPPEKGVGGTEDVICTPDSPK